MHQNTTRPIPNCGLTPVALFVVICAFTLMHASSVLAGACSGYKGCDSFGPSQPSFYSHDDFSKLASGAVVTEKAEKQWDLSGLSVRYTGADARDNTEHFGRKMALELQGFLAEHTSPLVVKALSGEHKGGVSDGVEGMGYKVKWSKNGLKLKVKYNF